MDMMIAPVIIARSATIQMFKLIILFRPDFPAAMETRSIHLPFMQLSRNRRQSLSLVHQESSVSNTIHSPFTQEENLEQSDASLQVVTDLHIFLIQRWWMEQWSSLLQKLPLFTMVHSPAMHISSWIYSQSKILRQLLSDETRINEQVVSRIVKSKMLLKTGFMLLNTH